MAGLKERVRKHADPERVRRLEVPEWGDESGKPLVITYGMVTLGDLAKVHELEGANAPWQKQAARIVVMKARDEDGKPLFAMGDAHFLMTEASPGVVNRIAISMYGSLTIEDAVKN